MRFGAAKRFGETEWKRRWAYSLFGEIHVPGWIRAQHVFRELAKLPLPTHARFLDAGSGRGDVIHYLAERHPSWSLTGVELDSARLAQAKHIRDRIGFSNVQFVSGDICNLPFDRQFDVAVCLDVLEHIPDDSAAFAALFRALKPGGYLIVTSPSVPQPKHLPLVAWREKRIGFQPADYGHVREGYSLDDLHREFSKNERSTVDVRYTYGPFGLLAFDLFFCLGDSRPNPALFALAFPFLKALGWADLFGRSQHGAAVMGIARKALAQGAHA